MSNETDLVEHITYYYEKSLTVLNNFGGPSVYFHVQAIKQQEMDFMSDRHIEMIYATLASWGMHRMGDTRTKMKKFSVFKQSLISQISHLSELRGLKMSECNEEQYCSYLENLKVAYEALHVSESDSTLVANSKTLAHILPHLIPPIDRQYTIRFFTQDNKEFYNESGKYKPLYFPKGEDQFTNFKDYCRRIKRMFDQCDRHLFKLEPDTFNTSYPKIMDNVIMAFVKDVSKPGK